MILEIYHSCGDLLSLGFFPKVNFYKTMHHHIRNAVFTVSALRTPNIMKPFSFLYQYIHLYSDGSHHHKHQGLDPLICSVSRVTVALSNVSLVFLLSFFLVPCSGMISRGFAFVASFASVKTSLVCIHLVLYLIAGTRLSKP